MQKNKMSYFQIFKETFLMSCLSFGGGYIIINMLKDKFVDKYKVFEESDLMDMYAIAQASPGAIAVNISTLCASKVRGVGGIVVGLMGVTLPPLIIIGLVSLVYQDLIQNQIVLSLFKGMEAGVAASILALVLDMYEDLKKSISASWMIYLVWSSLLLALVFNLHVILVIFLNLFLCIVISAGVSKHAQTVH